MTSSIHNPGHGQGLTLIEVMVGLLLITSCIIGIAALYTQSDHVNRGGRLHAVAAHLSEEMATLIRNQYEVTASFETGLGHTCNTTQALPDVENEVACWQDKVARELGNGSARIVLDDSRVPPQYVITISWADPLAGTASYVQRVAIVTAPRPAMESAAATHAAN